MGSGGAAFEMEDSDDWGLSAEDLDLLEADAIRKISERKASSATSSTSPLGRQAAAAASNNRPLRSPDRPFSGTSLESRHNKAEDLPPSGVPLVDTSIETGKDTASMLSKLPVKFFLHASGVIAAKFPYHPLLVDAFRKIPSASWHRSERLWMLPPSSLTVAKEVLSAVDGVDIEVEDFPPSGVPSVDTSIEIGKDTESTLSKLPVKFFLHASGVIAAKFSYHTLLADAFHKIPRASWHGSERLWMVPPSSLDVAEEVLSAVDGVDIEVQKLNSFVHRALNAASAVPDLRGLYDRMPSYIEAKLLPFQREGVRFVLQHGGRALLADEMGLGKTLQAIAVAACIPDAWPVLVVTPSSLRLQWASMIQQWLNIPSSDILVVLPQCGGSNKAGFNIVFSNLKSNIQLDGVFNIVSYDTVHKIKDMLLAAEFKIVIADESHFMKNPQAKRTTACLPILQKAQYSILLSGTPALSRPIELFKQLEALYPGVYKNVHDYGNRYCKGGHFGLYQGASNHEELHNLMKATVMIRRLKKDVLSQLPVKRRQQVFLDLSEKDLKPIRILFHELEKVKMNIRICDSTEKIDSLGLMQKKLMNKIYNDSAEAKIPAVLDYLGTIVEADCKFLIFAHHHPMIDAIHQFLLKKKVGCIRIDGGTPSSMRQALVTDFQEKDSVKAAVLSIKAGGIGLTLTAATTVIFAELSWTPGDIIQAEDRAHRIGQVSSVNIYYLLANDTVDDIIWDVVQGKLENLGQMLDGEENTLQVSSPQKIKSPQKQATLYSSVSSSQTGKSPQKQATLDSFIKRCNRAEDAQHKAKNPKF